MIVHLTKNSSNSRTENKSSSDTSIESGQIDTAIFCGNKISNNTRVNRRKKQYAWTRMREPANKPVKDLQTINAHME